MTMSEPDIPDVTLAYADPDILSCWEGKVRQGLECTLTIKHKQGKITTVLQCHSNVSLEARALSSSICQADKQKKKRKNKGGKTKKLESLLLYHQRLVEEKGLPASELMKKHAASSPDIQAKDSNQFSCDLCDYTSTSQRGVKTHKGHKHKEQLREEPGDNSLELSPNNKTRDEDVTIPLAESTFKAEGEGVVLFQCDLCDFRSDDETDIKNHTHSKRCEGISSLIKEHTVLEQLDGNVSMKSTEVEEDTKEKVRKTDLFETEADFLIKFNESKTKEEVSSDLQKLWDSNLKVDLGWETIVICEIIIIIQVQLEKGESMNQLLDTISWPTDCTHVSTNLKKLVFHIRDS